MEDKAAMDGSVEVIFSAEEIARRVDELAQEIAGRRLDDLLVIAVLKGSFVFAADLIRALHRAGLDPEIDFITLGSYGKSEHSSGRVTILRDVDVDVKDRNVLLVDDVLDSGRTLVFASDLLKSRGARTLFTCVLLEKHIPRAQEIAVDFRAFDCPEVFVVGYGMDAAHRYRELPYVGRIIKE